MVIFPFPLVSSIVTFDPSFELKADSRLSSSLDFSLLLVWFLLVLFSEFSRALTESCSNKTLSRIASIFDGSTPNKTFAWPSDMVPFSSSFCAFSGNDNSLNEFAIELRGFPTLLATWSCV